MVDALQLYDAAFVFLRRVIAFVEMLQFVTTLAKFFEQGRMILQSFSMNTGLRIPKLTFASNWRL